MTKSMLVLTGAIVLALSTPAPGASSASIIEIENIKPQYGSRVLSHFEKAFEKPIKGDGWLRSVTVTQLTINASGDVHGRLTATYTNPATRFTGTSVVEWTVNVKKPDAVSLKLKLDTFGFHGPSTADTKKFLTTLTKDIAKALKK